MHHARSLGENQLFGNSLTFRRNEILTLFLLLFLFFFPLIQIPSFCLQVKRIPCDITMFIDFARYKFLFRIGQRLISI